MSLVYLLVVDVGGIYGRVSNCFQNGMMDNQMLKVVLRVHSLQLRLRDCHAEILIKKKKESIQVPPPFRILNGAASLQVSVQFYLDPDDPVLTIQVMLYLGNERKLGGETVLKLLEWQSNVYHHSVAGLSHSPDKQSRLDFDFYYFLDQNVVDRRPLFLSGERLQPEYTHLQQRNRNLQQEKEELERQAASWASKNEQLEASRNEICANMNHREQQHQVELSQLQASLQHHVEEELREQEKEHLLARLAHTHPA